MNITSTNGTPDGLLAMLYDEHRPTRISAGTVTELSQERYGSVTFQGYT